jgi:putative transposase
MVEADGRAPVVQAHSGDMQDRDGARAAQGSAKRFPFIKLVFTDSVCYAQRVRDAASLVVEVVKRLAGHVGTVVLPRRWVVERFFAWINRNRRAAKDFGGTVASAEIVLNAGSIMLLFESDGVIGVSAAGRLLPSGCKNVVGVESPQPS